MFSSTAFVALVSVLLVALSAVDAYPLQRGTTSTITMTSRKTSENLKNTVSTDRARALAMNRVGGTGKRSALRNTTAFNMFVDFTAQVAVGSPPYTYTLLLDTGSSNTWVGAQQLNPYRRSQTSVYSGQGVAVQYGSGSFAGLEYSDTLAFGYGFSIQNQGIGAANTSTGFDGVDGILGLGPMNLTAGTVGVDNNSTIPTVVDTMLSQGVINSEALGVYFAPATSASPPNGELTFGGADSSKLTSEVNYAPLTKQFPASDYWGVDSSIAYGSDTILSTTAGIVDTGTTLVLIATDAYKKYKAATGGVDDKHTRLLKITSVQYDKLENLTFTINGRYRALTPNAQIWPRSLNTYLGGETGSIYLIVGDIGTYSGQGLDFIIGFAFLQRFYTVYNTADQTVGFATTSYTDAITN